MRISPAEKTLNYVVLVLTALFAVIPVVTIVTTAFTPKIGEAPGIHPENLLEAWSVGGFGTALVGAIIVVILALVLALTSITSGLRERMADPFGTAAAASSAAPSPTASAEATSEAPAATQQPAAAPPAIASVAVESSGSGDHADNADRDHPSHHDVGGDVELTLNDQIPDTVRNDDQFRTDERLPANAGADAHPGDNRRY